MYTVTLYGVMSCNCITSTSEFVAFVGVNSEACNVVVAVYVVGNHLQRVLVYTVNDRDGTLLRLQLLRW